MSIKNFNGLPAMFALAVLLMFSLGCGLLSKMGKTSTSGNRNAGYPTPQKQDPTTPAKSGLDEKTQLYISKCFNKYANSVMDSYQRYTSWLKDPDKGPTGKESLVYGLYEIHGDGGDCASAVTEANAMEPRLTDAEQAADDFSKNLKSAIDQINNIYAYYDRGDYKDDNFQKGKEAHPALIEALKNFAAADKKFAEILDGLEEQVSQARLEELRGDPNKQFDYTVVDFGIQAKKISSYVQHTKFADMSADELQKLTDNLEPKILAMKDSGKSKTMASTYFSSVDDFLTSAKELMRRVRDHKPFTSFEKEELGTQAGWMIDGSPDKVLYSYNQLIEREKLIHMGL